MTSYFDNYEKAAKKIIDHVGKNIVIGIPIGIGKPIGFVNALYRLAEADKSIQLTILTALTLSRPSTHSELEKRFLEPILNRMLKNYEDPLYEKARKIQTLPNNIKVIEFFLTPGEYSHNRYAQQNYISSNYSTVVNDLMSYSINVIAQQVSQSKSDPNDYSLSCNTDLFHAVLQHLNTNSLSTNKIALVAEINANLPFMPGEDAVVKAETWTDIIDTKNYPALFSIPRNELSTQEHLIGLYASCLVKDNSCMQIGIGSLNNAIANALIIRNNQNSLYQAILQKLHVQKKFDDAISTVGTFTPFEHGLYASTEMFSDEYIHLYKEGILKKKVYDHIGLQKLINLQIISETISPDILDKLIGFNIIHPVLSAEDTDFLVKFGIFKSETRFENEYLILPSGEKIIPDLTSHSAKQKILTICLGNQLKNGKILHAAFYIGSNDFYQQLHDFSSDELQLFAMTSVTRTNSVLWNNELSTLQRQNARFFNFSMMVSLGGAVISDGLKNLQEISGVGGQFDFVNMATILPQARSIIACRSVRQTKQGVESNIVWEYPNQTISRCFRDIVVTEYGIADCRSKTDSEVIKSILNITDSRFQNGLLTTAKKFGKIPNDYKIPPLFQQNYPDQLNEIIAQYQSKKLFKSYPFGSDLTEVEQVIANALLKLKKLSTMKVIYTTFLSIFSFRKNRKYDIYLNRLGLLHPKTLKEFIYKRLIQHSIRG